MEYFKYCVTFPPCVFSPRLNDCLVFILILFLWLNYQFLPKLRKKKSFDISFDRFKYIRFIVYFFFLGNIPPGADFPFLHSGLLLSRPAAQLPSWETSPTIILSIPFTLLYLVSHLKEPILLFSPFTFLFQWNKTSKSYWERMYENKFGGTLNICNLLIQWIIFLGIEI